MNSSPRPLTLRTSLRRGLGLAGAAVAVAFVGTAGLGAADARAAGVSTGVTFAGPSARIAPAPATHPANLPPARSLAVRYSFEEGELRQL